MSTSNDDWNTSSRQIAMRSRGATSSVENRDTVALDGDIVDHPSELTLVAARRHGVQTSLENKFCNEFAFVRSAVAPVHAAFAPPQYMRAGRDPLRRHGEPDKSRVPRGGP